MIPIDDYRIEVRAHRLGGWIVGVRRGAAGAFVKQWKRVTEKLALRATLDVAARYRAGLVRDVRERFPEACSTISSIIRSR